MQDYTISGIVLIAMFICFIGIVFWAWSKKRNTEFSEASHLPLEDEIKVVETLNNKEQQGNKES